jgi:hypothetical protein
VRKRFLVAMVGFVVAAFLALPGAANAQTATQDSVTGTASYEIFAPEPVQVTDVFSVFSGPSGENATGTVTGTAGVVSIVADVTCLAVTGNRAVIGLMARPPDSFDLYLVVVDGGASGQDASAAVGSPGPSTDCASVTSTPSLTPYSGGNVVITDAPPFPTTRDQCKNAGWRQFGFKNKGQCVSFVATGGKHHP